MASRPSPIVVGTDFSEPAADAVAQGRALAVSAGCDLVVVHVSPPVEPGSDSFYTDRGRRLRHQQLQRGARMLDAIDVSEPPVVRRRLEEGAPASQLVAIAAEEGAWLLVVGASGRGRLERWLLGSVADEVIRSASVDVLLARGAPRPLQRLLVPTDFGPLSNAALELATELVAGGGHIDLLHCWLPPPVAAEAASVVNRVRDSVRERGSAAARRGGPEVRFVERCAPPGAGIGQQLAALDYDLVVMGSSERSGVRRLVLGSVAENTARHAPCSALLVKRPRAAGDSAA